MRGEEENVVETYQPPFGLDERAILPVHLVIESAGVTQIVTRTVPPPQGSRRGPAVHTLSTFCKNARTHTHTHSTHTRKEMETAQVS